MNDKTENIDAERAAFEAWAESAAIRTDLGAWEAWQAARRTPSASIGEDGLPGLPDARAIRAGDSFPKVYALAYTADQMRQYARDAIAADRLARRPRVKPDPELMAALDEASKTRSTGALLPDGSAVFINYGDQPEDTSHLECTACGGSGHIDDQRLIAGQSGEDGLPRWIDDQKGKDPLMDDMIAYIIGLRAQLARQSQGEPVAWLYKWIGADGARKPGDVIARMPAELGGNVDLYTDNWERLSPLYAAPPLSSEQQADTPEEEDRAIRDAMNWGVGVFIVERRRDLAHAQLPLDAEVALEHAALSLSRAGDHDAHHHVTQVLAAHLPPLDGQSDTEGGAHD